MPLPLGEVRVPKNLVIVLARERPRPPCVKGKRSAVAAVNDSPVGCQSRDRARHSELSPVRVTKGLLPQYDFA